MDCIFFSTIFFIKNQLAIPFILHYTIRSNFERRLYSMFILLAGGLLVIIIAVVIAVISSVVSAVAADQDIES